MCSEGNRLLSLTRDSHRLASAPVHFTAHRALLLLVASFVVAPVAQAAVCDPNAFQGAYGFSLTGPTTIGGPTRPIAVVGRLVLDGAGNVSGISSASFTGLPFGNPVRGTYEAHWDCSVTWNLQDDSGNYQHFAGTITPNGEHIAYRQADPGGAEDGIMLRTMDGCSDSSLAGKFTLSISGATLDVDTAVESGRVSFTGLLNADGAGRFSFATRPDLPTPAAGTYAVRGDCFAELTLELRLGSKTETTHFRAVLVENGRQVLAVETDPGTVVALRLVSK
jgi:hypothetical protein